MKDAQSRSNIAKFSRTFTSVLAALTAILVLSSVPAAAAPNSGSDKADAKETKPQNIFEKNNIKLVEGPAQVKLGRHAELDLPANFAFVGGDSLKKYYDLTQNPYSGNEIGVVLSSDGWQIFFDYADSGHIDDSDRTELDADALYKQMEEGQAIGNQERKKKGWDELALKGWTAKPHYDEKTNNLTWAFRMASSRDNYKETFINQNIRLLGRTGYVSAIVVGDDSADYAKTEAAANALLKNFRFTQGQTYAEFRSGDKVAKYGLAALVLGGAGAVAAKTGFFAKFAKFIMLGVAAVGAWFLAMFKKLFSRKNRGDRFDDNSNS
ncbi:MAG: DUF2167 domain-containing protein [Proteobacteria bacterium]|nr:DUF2167 domain-containing protein [Pseudomonadota bacterium]